MEKDWFRINKDEVIKRLKVTLDSSDLLFIGKFESENENDFGFFKDVRSVSGVRKFYPTNQGEPDEDLVRPVEVWSKKVIFFNEGKRKQLVNGNWYKFYTTLSHPGLAKKQDNPFLLQTDLSRAAEITEFSGFELIENIQKDAINTPESVRGKLTRSIEAISNEINTQAATFIFELIQNADDYPNKEKSVAMSFVLSENHLIVKHNGAPFEVNNTVAICDINEGDKRGEIEKIGFKGIGFKSIFKDCNIAYIRSGEYSFRFDELKWKNEGRNLFWQITPINTPKEDYETNLKPLNPVNLVIHPREKNRLSQYKNTFIEHFKDERILLFLRNVKEIEFGLGEQSFSIKTSNKHWDIKKEANIIISDEIKSSLERGIALNDKRIPLKFKGIEKTEISFGFSITDKKINYLDDATIFTYLPTKVNIGFGFLLNANFIPDGSRTVLHNDLLWNEYLFEKAGELFPLQLSKLIENGYEVSSVINLIPNFEDLLSTRDKDIISFIEAFKKGFDSTIQDVAIVPSQNGGYVNISDLVFDDTGISAIMNDQFHSVFDTQGELVSLSIEKSALNKIKRYLNETKPESIFTLDNLYDSFKKEQLNNWLLNQENNSKFISYIGKSSIRFSKFSNEAILLGYDSFKKENLKLYPAKSLYKEIPAETCFIDLPIISYKTLEVITENNLSFELNEFDSTTFLKVILNKKEELERNLENLDKAWIFLFLHRDNKVDGSLIVNERFKDFPIKTITGEIKKLEECFAGDLENANNDFSFLYQEYGKDALARVDVSSLAELAQTENKQIVSFLSGIHERVRITDKALFKRAFKQLLKTPHEELAKEPEKLVKALISVFNYSIAYPNENLIDYGILDFPVITHNQNIAHLAHAYFDKNYSSYINAEELNAEKLFQGIEDILFISNDYLSYCPEEAKHKFVDFLKHYFVSPGLKYFNSTIYKINERVNLVSIDSCYQGFNNGYTNFRTANEFYVFRDIAKLAGFHNNLIVFWEELSKLKFLNTLISEISCNGYTRINPFIWLLSMNHKMFPMQGGNIVKEISEINEQKLSKFLFNEEQKLHSCFNDRLNIILEALKFNSRLSNSDIIKCLQSLSIFSFEEIETLLLEHFPRATFTAEEIDIINSTCSLLAEDKSIQMIYKLVYLEKSLADSSVLLENTNYSKNKFVYSFTNNANFKNAIKALKIPIKGIEDIELKQVEENSGFDLVLIKKVVSDFSNKVIKSAADLELIEKSEFISCSQISIGINGISDFNAQTDSFYDSTNNIYYFIDVRDLVEVICEQYNWPLIENRKLRKLLENAVKSEKNQMEQVIAVNNDKFTEEVNEFIKELEGTEWSQHIVELKTLLQLDLSPGEQKKKVYNLLAKLKLAKYRKIQFENVDEGNREFNYLEGNGEKYIVHSARGSFAYIAPIELLKMRDEGYMIALDFGNKSPIKIYQKAEDILGLNTNHLLLYQNDKTMEELFAFCESNQSANKRLLIIDKDHASNKSKELLKLMIPDEEY